MEKSSYSSLDKGGDGVPGNKSMLDAGVLDMIEIAEKAVIVLAMHLNDSCDGEIDSERAEMLCSILSIVVNFLNSADKEQKVAFLKGFLAKNLVIEGLGAFLMRHWTGE